MTNQIQNWQNHIQNQRNDQEHSWRHALFCTIIEINKTLFNNRDGDQLRIQILT